MFSMIKLIRKVWKHTWDTHLWFQNSRKTKQSFSALFWLKKASTAGQEQSTPTNHQGLTSPPQPHSFPIKTHGRGGERSCQRPAQAPTASTLWRRLYILHKWHHWGKISQESASLTSVSVLSKSEMIYPQKNLSRHARTYAQGCTPSLRIMMRGSWRNLTEDWSENYAVKKN